MAMLPMMGGGLSETVLWTNPDTSVDFGAQVVTLSDSLDNYSYIKINYRYNKGSGTESISIIISVDDFKKTSVRPGHKCSITVLDNTYWYTRYYWYTSSTTVQIYPCYRTSSNGMTQTNNVVIPNYISGLK